MKFKVGEVVRVTDLDPIDTILGGIREGQTVTIKEFISAKTKNDMAMCVTSDCEYPIPLGVYQLRKIEDVVPTETCGSKDGSVTISADRYFELLFKEFIFDMANDDDEEE